MFRNSFNDLLTLIQKGKKEKTESLPSNALWAYSLMYGSLVMTISELAVWQLKFS